jgi:glycerol uptake facilitator-like aquaporin
MTGSTCINPAVGICLQMVAAWGAGDAMIFFRDVWPLVFPSILGGIIGGLFMTTLYEPLLLFIKYRDLAD